MHTPIPWHYQEVSDAYTHIVRSPGNRLIAQLSQDSSGQAEADARLIVRAVNCHEELLAACKAVVAEPFGCPCCDSGKLRSPLKEHFDDCPYVLLNAAIAKAESQEGKS